jgi:hypothetical protein
MMTEITGVRSCWGKKAGISVTLGFSGTESMRESKALIYFVNQPAPLTVNRKFGRLARRHSPYG